MKKYILLLSTVIAMTLSSCGGTTNNDNSNERSDNSNTSESISENNSISEESISIEESILDSEEESLVLSEEESVPVSEEESLIPSEEESLPMENSESEEESVPYEESISTENVKINLKIACPSGAPAVALYNMYKNSNVEINANANNVIGYLSTDSNKDIVIAPTNALVAVIKKNAPFRIAATVTFGNFYIASTGNDDNGIMDKSDYVVLFQQNGLPDKIFNYVYGTDFDNLHYVTAASDANRCLISGINASDNNSKVDYVLVPQPALTTGLSKNAKASLYADVQSDYKNKSNGLEITQASIFVRDSADKTQVNAFLNQIEKDIKNLLKDPSLIEDALKGLEDEQAQAKFGANATMLKTVLSNNSLGLGFKNALTNKASIDNFLISLNFSNEETNENVYYQ